MVKKEKEYSKKINIKGILMAHDDDNWLIPCLMSLDKYVDGIYVNLNNPTPTCKKIIESWPSVKRIIYTTNKNGKWNQGLQRDNTIRMLDDVQPDVVLFPDSVTGDTPILIKRNGIIDFIEIQELAPSEDHTRLQYKNVNKKISVLTKNGFRKIKWVKKHKVKKNIYRIAGEGYCKVTGDHSLFKQNKQIKGSQVKIGDNIDRIKFTDNNQFNSITNKFAELLGFFVAEGHASITKIKRGNQYNWNLSEQSTEKLKRYGEILKEFYGNNYYLIESKKKKYKSVYRLWPRDPQHICNDFLRSCYTKSKKKKVPKIILNGSEDIIKSFLKGYYDGDGYKHYKSFCSDSNSFILSAGIVYLLNKLNKKYSLEIRKDKSNIVRINELIRSHKKTGIRKILIEKNYTNWVYDICTTDGTFVGGVGNILFKNSDETFPKDFKNTLNKFIKSDINTLWFGLMYYWNHPCVARRDGRWKSIHHVRAYRWQPGITYIPYIGYTNPTTFKDEKKFHSPSAINHWGYMIKQDRERKYSRNTKSNYISKDRILKYIKDN